ncbi:Nuclear transport factor 2 (NTF2) family protein [Euphorbia peplus]|nr:Nuclear transport factor 2 (NTF2) family protein [Euphorbia peplus]
MLIRSTITSPPPPSSFRPGRKTLAHWKGSSESCYRTARRQGGSIVKLAASSSENNPTVVVVQTSSTTRKEGVEVSASEIVMKFYDGVNGHDLASVEELIADKCVYEDLIFPRPFVGRKAILEFFQKFNDSISTDLRFVIDDISAEDSLAVGVTWHLEWKGKPFPFSKGCSFYRLEVINGTKQIIYGRDSVEPAIKPGEAALSIIQGVAWLLERFPQLEDQL